MGNPVGMVECARQATLPPGTRVRFRRCGDLYWAQAQDLVTGLSVETSAESYERVREDVLDYLETMQLVLDGAHAL